MIQPMRRFTNEFKDEAVRLALTSGRMQREIASELGIGQSTLSLWINQSRNRPAEPGNEQTDASMITELNQLRRENEILRPENEQLLRENKSLRQERDILKQLVAFYMRMQVGEVRSSIRRNG